MTVLATGVAGFIGIHTSRALMARGDRAVGADDLNDDHDLSLKRARPESREGNVGFVFAELDIAKRASVAVLIFLNRIVAGEPIPVNNIGEMCRDFVCIDGNDRAERPRDFNAGIEREFGFKLKTLIEDGIPQFDFWCPEFHET